MTTLTTVELKALILPEESEQYMVELKSSSLVELPSGHWKVSHQKHEAGHFWPLVKRQ